MSYSNQNWKIKQETSTYSCRIFDVFKLDAEGPDGRPHEFHILKPQNWANICAITEKETMVFIRQFRIGIQDTCLEIPGGIIDPEDPSPLEAARRELLEETGYEAKNFRQIGVSRPNPAIMSNYCYSFLADGAIQTSEQNLDPSEDMTVIEIPLSEIEDKVRNGEIDHAIIVAALYYYRLSQ